MSTSSSLPEGIELGGDAGLADKPALLASPIGTNFNIERGIADGAMPGERSASEAQDNLPAIGSVEALLTDVVLRLRANWIAHMGASWPSICAINELASTEIEKRVASLLRESFADFGQLLCGFEVFLLEQQKLSVVSKEAVLGLEQLGIQITDDRCDLVELMNGKGGLAQFLRSLQRRKESANGSQVHGDSPLEGTIGVGTIDSTTVGNPRPELAEAGEA